MLSKLPVYQANKSLKTGRRAGVDYPAALSVIVPYSAQLPEEFVKRAFCSFSKLAGLGKKK